MALSTQGMADEMENQLRMLWHAQYGHEFPEIGREQRNLLFLAIARGVLKYLKDQEDAHNEHLFSQITLSNTDYDGGPWSFNIDNTELNVAID
jgi:hypothetical protein